MMKHKLFLILICCSLAVGAANAQITDRERPQEWDRLVPGAKFMDRFLPMQGQDMSSDTWGAEYVRPRLVDNGIEDNIWSYWGGNILKDDAGKYHMMVCGWLENSPKGHMTWSKSFTFNSVSDSLQGPYKIVDLIGDGHNPEAYRIADGRYVLYVIKGRYVANSLDGPWEYGKYDFETRDREIIEGLSNLSFAKREDGSFLMVDRGGGIWVSPDGISPWKLITHESVYPKVNGEFEDPVIWRDNVQYNLIVNDWLGRIAFYLRSADGVNWVVDPGEAYMPGIAKHKDGSTEDWFKYERLKVYQDEHGRAIQANFAVIDTLKHEDKPYDRHSSKNITIPLNPGLLLAIEGPAPVTHSCREVKVRVKGEPDFNPNADLDIASVRFGTSDDVNYGGGSPVKEVVADGGDAIFTFDIIGNTIAEDEFALKLIGRYADGSMAYGFARLPQVPDCPVILSACAPIASGNGFAIEIENFGMGVSPQAQVLIESTSGALLAQGKVGELKPYEKARLHLPAKGKAEIGDDVKVLIKNGNKLVSSFPTKIK